jgi:hypothetical protein
MNIKQRRVPVDHPRQALDCVIGSRSDYTSRVTINIDVEVGHSENGRRSTRLQVSRVVKLNGVVAGAGVASENRQSHFANVVAIAALSRTHHVSAENSR